MRLNTEFYARQTFEKQTFIFETLRKSDIELWTLFAYGFFIPSGTECLLSS